MNYGPADCQGCRNRSWLPRCLSPVSKKCPRQESNLVLDLRRVACVSGTLQGHIVCQYLARESNPVLRFRRPPCVHHTRKACCRVARPGIEPGPTASEAVMRSSTLTSQNVSTPTWNRTGTKTLGESCAVRYTIGTKSLRLDLHQHHPVYKTGAFLSRATSAIKKGDRAESNRRQTDSQSVSGNQHRTRPQRKERELNPQGTFVLDRLPTGSRRQSGCPSVLSFQSVARPGIEPGTSR